MASIRGKLGVRTTGALDARPLGRGTTKGGLRARGEELDHGVVLRRSGESGIAGDQRNLEDFGESDVGGVVRGQPAPQLPDPIEEREVRVAHDAKVMEIEQGIRCTLCAHLASCDEPSQTARELDVDEVRCSKVVVAIEASHELGARVACCESLDRGGRVDDDHSSGSEPRSSRIA